MLALSVERFERRYREYYPESSLYMVSMRTQERFSRSVLEHSRKFREMRFESPLAQAILFSIDQYYGDLVGRYGVDVGDDTGGPYLTKLDEVSEEILNSFYGFVSRDDLKEYDPNIIRHLLSSDSPHSTGMAARAFYTREPVLANVHPWSDNFLTRTMRQLAESLSAKLSILYGHPFTEERQLVGHRVPKEGEEKLVQGLGEVVRGIREAQTEFDVSVQEGRPARKHVLLIKNVESMDPEVRIQLQEALRIGELTHPELGVLKFPPNFQIQMTKRAGAHMQDESFYDRLVTKKADFKAEKPINLASFPSHVTEENFLNYIRIEIKSGRKFLVFPNGKKVELDPTRFKNLDEKNFQDEIYKQAGLVLDFDTVRILAALQESEDAGIPMIRVEGPTGVGKTFTSGGFADLRGSDFLSNPVSEGTELSDWIGWFERNEEGHFRFNSETSFKERLENGGVVALSELNSLIDLNDEAKLAWWLVQIAETEPNSEGYRTIRLTEVPVPEGAELHAIRMHPKSLIVIDTNPEGDYAARGSFPDVFKEYAPVLKVSPFITGEKSRERIEKEKLRRYLELFLKHDWIIQGEVKAKGISDSSLRRKIGDQMAECYWQVAGSHARGEFGQGESAVFSVRELKRMAEDVLYGLGEGTESNLALQKAIQVHLLFRWERVRNRTKAAEVLQKRFPEFEAMTEPVSISEFLKDQSLNKGRATHVRVSADTDIREELGGFLSENPKVRMKIFPITKATDRMILEGGLAPAVQISEEEETPWTENRTEFGQGILGHLVAEAESSPDEEIFYVLENNHNLRPEEAVALNEILQEGNLYLKGRDRKSRLPRNAHILFVSRQDSEISWSAAEQSRLVTMHFETTPDRQRQLLDESIGRLLASRGAPAQLIQNLETYILSIVRDFRREVRYRDQNASKYSQSRFRRFLDLSEKELRSTPRGDLSSDRLYDSFHKVFGEVFLSALQEDLTTDLFRTTDIYKRAFSWHESDKPDRSESLKTGDIVEDSLTASEVLNQARIDLSSAKDKEERKVALGKLSKFMEKSQEEFTQTPYSIHNPISLRYGDIVEAMPAFNDSNSKIIDATIAIFELIVSAIPTIIMYKYCFELSSQMYHLDVVILAGLVGLVGLVAFILVDFSIKQNSKIGSYVYSIVGRLVYRFKKVDRYMVTGSGDRAVNIATGEEVEIARLNIVSHLEPKKQDAREELLSRLSQLRLDLTSALVPLVPVDPSVSARELSQTLRSPLLKENWVPKDRDSLKKYDLIRAPARVFVQKQPVPKYAETRLTPDGKNVFIVDGQKAVHRYGFEGGQIVGQILGDIRNSESISISPDAGVVIVGEMVWEMQDGNYNFVGPIRGKYPTQKAQISQDNKTVLEERIEASAGPSDLSFHAEAHLYRRTKGGYEKKRVLGQENDQFQSFKMSGDGKVIVGQGKDKVRVFGKEVLDLEGLPESVRSVWVSEDGSRIIVTGAWDNRFYNNDNKLVTTFPGALSVYVYDLKGSSYQRNQVLQMPEGKMDCSVSKDGSTFFLTWNERGIVAAMEPQIYRLRDGIYEKVFCNQNLLDPNGLFNADSIKMSGNGNTIAFVRGTEEGSEILVLRWNGESYELIWKKKLGADSGIDMDLDEGGETVLLTDDQEVSLWRLDVPMMVQEDGTFLDLERGVSYPRADLPDEVSLFKMTAAPAQSSINTHPFTPRYGEKPFYYLADEEGTVYLNFKGKLYPTRHELLNPTMSSDRARENLGDKTFWALEFEDIRNPYS
ncbi:MAG: hypothetical protein HYY63_04850, partial [Elusimicrobia bacterium]|nr:hypothetical protein [Elusimicrobiota bacterium]